MVEQLHRQVRARNRELAFQAVVEIGLGLVFSIVTFGGVFMLSWVFGFFAARSMGLTGWQLALIVTGLYALIGSISAWRRVDPLADVAPLTEQQWRLTMLSLGTPGITYVSPRHTTAGFAWLLIAGPANILDGIGTWRHRLASDQRLLDEAAELLRRVAGESDVDLDDLTSPHAALLLRRLALIKVMPTGATATITLTERGRQLVS